MANHSEIIDREIGRDKVRAQANARTASIAVTDDEVVVAKAGWFSKKLDRYPRSALESVRLLPANGSEMLAISFQDQASVSLLFDLASKGDAERLTALLQAQLAS